MDIIIIGCGKVGSKFAEILAAEGHEVVIVDWDANSFTSLDPNFNGITITGVPIDQDVLRQAGIETCDAFAAVTPDDNINIMACQVAKEIFKVPKVIARIYNPAREQVFHQFGLETICPTNITVDFIHSIIVDSGDTKTMTLGSNLLAFKQRAITEEQVGKRAVNIKLKPHEFLFGVMQKNGIFLYPNADLKLSTGDTLVISTKVD